MIRRLCLLFLLLVLAAGCSRDMGYVGTWEAIAQDGGTVVLEIDEAGRGTWSTGTDTLQFKWSVKDGDLVLHTRSGGVMVGVQEDGCLRVEVPGSDEMCFRRKE